MESAGKPFVPPRGVLRVRFPAESLDERRYVRFVRRVRAGRVRLMIALGVQSRVVLGGLHDVARRWEGPN